MAIQTLFFNRLKEGVTPEAYEAWVRERDYPTARALSSIRSYEIMRLDEPARPGGIDVPADYLEVVTVTTYEEYESELASMLGRDEFVAELRSFVDCVLVVRSHTI